jgi:uncharacterized protein (TIRG00374 family)
LGARGEPVSKRLVWTGCKIVLGLVLLAFVIWRNWSPPEGSGPGLADALQRPVQVVPLVLAAGFCLAGVLLTFVRWYVLVRAQDLPFKLSDAMRLGLVGFFFNTFLPGSIGGDVVKAAFLAREQSRRTVAVATVLLDRAIGFWGLFWLVSISGSLFWVLGDPALHASRSLQRILLGAIVVVGSSLIGWALMGFLPDRRAHRFAGRLSCIPKIGGSLAEFWRAVWIYRRRGRSVALALALALVAQVGLVLAFHFAAHIFKAPHPDAGPPSVAEHFLIVPLGFTIEVFVPTPGGIGGGELGFGGLYKLTGHPEAEGVIAAVGRRVILWTVGFFGFLVYLQMKPTLPAGKPTTRVGTERRLVPATER